MTANELSREEKPSATIPYLLLVSRTIFFLFFQAMVAILVRSWETSEKYWLLTATLANMVSIALLIVLFKREGSNYFSIFKVDRDHLKKDVLIFSGLVLITVPLVFLPGYLLSTWIWGNPDVQAEMMFGAIQPWLIYPLLLAFPLTIAFAELATYFVYIMPRLKRSLKVRWLAWLLPVIFLSVQHCTLPFIPDWDFILFRALEFLPFAIMVGVSLYLRPSLFIYFVIMHGLLDFGAALTFLMETR